MSGVVTIITLMADFSVEINKVLHLETVFNKNLDSAYQYNIYFTGSIRFPHFFLKNVVISITDILNKYFTRLRQK